MEIGGNKQEIFGIDNISLIKNIKHFDLCIEINKDDLSFALINENHELVRLEKHTIKSETEKEKINKIEKIILSNKFLKIRIRKCKLILNDDLFTIVPNNLFDIKKYKEYYKFCFEKNKNQEIIFKNTKSINATSIFSIDKDLKGVILDFFPKTQITHASINLINSFSNSLDNSENQNILININETNFQIILFEKDNLQLYNYFDYVKDEDFLFYFLYVSKKLKIKQKECIINLSGKIEATSNKTNLIKKYFKNINFMKLNNKTEIPFFFQNINEHNFYNILN